MTRFTWPDAFSSTSASFGPMNTMPIGWLSPDDRNVVASRFGSRIVSGVVSAPAGVALMIHAATAANHVRVFMLASVRGIARTRTATPMPRWRLLFSPLDTEQLRELTAETVNFTDDRRSDDRQAQPRRPVGLRHPSRPA